MFLRGARSGLRAIVVLACWIVVSPALARAQKTIAVDEDLRAHADALPVKYKRSKPLFGEYAVISRKWGVIKSAEKGKLLSTRTKRSSSQKFSIVLKGPATDTAHVEAVYKSESKEAESVQISWVSIGDDGLLEEMDTLTASIRINDDTAETWDLRMTDKVNWVQEGEDLWEFYLTNGKRTIVFDPVTSEMTEQEKEEISRRTFLKKIIDGNDPARELALGYQLSEDGRALAAFQFYSSPKFNLLAMKNKEFIYIHQDLEPRMKLVLAAAMTTVLSVRSGAMSFGPNPRRIIFR